MTFDGSTNTIKSVPDKQEYVDKKYVFVVRVEDAEQTVAVDFESTITVHDAMKWTWIAYLTDNLEFTGRIEFDHKIDMTWVEANFESMFTVSASNTEKGDPVSSDALKLTATKFDSDVEMPGQVLDFKISSYDFKQDTVTITVNDQIDGFASVFIRPEDVKEDSELELASLTVDIAILPTELTYEVTTTDNQTGFVRFSHPVNMKWLEENFSAFFAIYL